MGQSTRKIKLSRKIKTVDDLLARSDVNDVLTSVAETKPDIIDIICIYQTSDKIIHYSYAIKAEAKDDEQLKALGMLRYVEDMIIHPGNECEDE
jgi:hypothetical protein